MGKPFSHGISRSWQNNNLSCVKHMSDLCVVFLFVAVSFPQKKLARSIWYDTGIQ